jgi:hypothetical protein
LLNRVCKDIGILQLKQFALLSEKEVEILKQLEAWKGSYK